MFLWFYVSHPLQLLCDTGTFDGVISVSALQWICNADKSCHNPRHRMSKFFTSLYGCMGRGARAVFQFYPENPDQMQLVTTSVPPPPSLSLSLSLARARAFSLALSLWRTRVPSWRLSVCARARTQKEKETENEKKEREGEGGVGVLDRTAWRRHIMAPLPHLLAVPLIPCCCRVCPIAVMVRGQVRDEGGLHRRHRGGLP